MKLIAAIAVGCSIALLITGSFLWGGILLIVGIVVAIFANRPKRANHPSVPRDRLGGLDSFFGNG